MRKILFIDEFGDTGRLSPSSSDYFGICIIEIEAKSLPLVIRESNKFRYWNSFNKELKTLRKNQHDVFLEMVETLLQNDLLNYTIGYFHKRTYQGPYYQENYHDTKKLRNFSIRSTLEKHFEQHPIPSDIQTETELIFDRFDISKEYKDNFESYLKSNTKLPTFVDIVQIDSMVCEGLQIADFLSKVIKRKTDNFHNIDENLTRNVFEIQGNF